MDGQRVHVGTNADAAGTGAIGERSHHAGLCDSGGDLEAQPLEFAGDDGAGAYLLEQHFGMLVEIVADGRQFGPVPFQQLLDHRFCGTLFSSRLKHQTITNVSAM